MTALRLGLGPTYRHRTGGIRYTGLAAGSSDTTGAAAFVGGARGASTARAVFAVVGASDGAGDARAVFAVVGASAGVGAAPGAAAFVARAAGSGVAAGVASTYTGEAAGVATALGAAAFVGGGARGIARAGGVFAVVGASDGAGDARAVFAAVGAGAGVGAAPGAAAFVASAAGTSTAIANTEEAPISLLGTNGLWYDFSDQTEHTLGSDPSFSDLDQESATTSSWTALNSATLTKETTDPYAGVRDLKNAYSTTAFPIAQQAGLTSGTRYEVTAAVRSSAVGVTTKVVLGGAASVCETTSTSWQSITEDNTSDAGNLRLWSDANAGGEYSEYDAITIANLNITRVDPNEAKGTLASEYISQATAANQPWQQTDDEGVEYDDADFLDSSVAASTWKFAHDTMTMFLVFELNGTPTATEEMRRTMTAAASNVGILVRFASSNKIQVLVGNGTGTYLQDYTTTAAASDVAVVVLAIRLDDGDLSVWIDGTKETQSKTGVVSTGDPSSTMRAGGTDIVEASFWITDDALSDDNVDTLGEYFADKYGGTWT